MRLFKKKKTKWTILNTLNDIVAINLQNIKRVSFIKSPSNVDAQGKLLIMENTGEEVEYQNIDNITGDKVLKEILKHLND